MRIARDLGDMSLLFPSGITTLRDLPYSLFEAIRLALVFLSFDELPADERPARRIWLDTEKLVSWFDDVKRRREEKYGSGDGSWDKSIDDPVQNEATRGMRG